MTEENLWYKEGLPFKCTECGRCCGGSPGAVWLSSDDICNISSYLGLSETQFLEKYTHTIDGRLSLKEKPNFDCILLHEKKCSVYPVRPKQCRTYPFWPHILKSKENWEEAKKCCEGINDEAPLISLSEIKKNL